jgi:hypothetical protein
LLPPKILSGTNVPVYQGNYPFIPVVAMPCTKYFWRAKNNAKQGSIDNTDMANIDPHEDTPDESRKSRSPIGIVNF